VATTAFPRAIPEAEKPWVSAKLAKRLPAKKTVRIKDAPLSMVFM
jgi:hypothetical protein